MRILLLASGFLSSVLFIDRADAQKLDHAIHITSYAGAEGRRIYITKSEKEATELWFVKDACPTKPDLSVFISLMPVSTEQYIYITDQLGSADKVVCVTNKSQLDRNILRALKVLD